MAHLVDGLSGCLSFYKRQTEVLAQLMAFGVNSYLLSDDELRQLLNVCPE